MGNVLSGDERLSSFFLSYDKKPRDIVWIDDQFGYRPANKSQRREFEGRRDLYYDGHRQRITRQRSHSLGAIIGELHHSAEDIRGSYHGLGNCNHFGLSRSFLPRIKLSKDMPIKDLQYSSNLEVYRCSSGIKVKDTPRSVRSEKDKGDTDGRLTRCYGEEDLSCEIADKPEENYFTKNFDECMKRLESIEKEQEIMEADGEKNLNSYNLKKPLKRQMTPLSEEYIVPPSEQETEAGASEIGTEEEAPKESETETEMIREDGKASEEKCPPLITQKIEEESRPAQESPTNSNVTYPENNSKCTTGWYSKLKKQFESDSEDSSARETSCRVTGAMLKTGFGSSTLSETDGREMRHYFSRLVRPNKSLIDEELPDPDKVQNIRAMFQESLNSTLQKNFNKFGGSLQNINVKHCEDQFRRPKSAQGSRNEFDRILGNSVKDRACSNRTPINSSANRRASPGGDKNTQNDAERSRAQESRLAKLPNRKYPQPKWTDTTSLSSGVSSDLSSYDTDAECCSREEIEDNTTDDDLPDEVDDKHYIQSETLEKIRSFGTSVTYFGGQMIKCSVGPLLSPTTQAILDEIGEKYPDRRSFTRTFEEFYRKYTENNDLRKKKLGRTRSFGQTDVFQRQNTLNDTEIEMYKNDLEVEIGIRKPSGKSQNTLKKKLVKSISEGSRMEFFEKEVVEKLNEILEAAVEMAMSEKENEEQSQEKNDSAPEAAKEQVSFPNECVEDVTEESAVSTPKGSSTDDHMQNESRALLFGYEKDIFKKERATDMVFEEFEVCETVSEKVDKLEENSQSYRLTIKVNQENPEETEALEEIIINEQEPLDSLEIYLKKNRCDAESIQPVEGSERNGGDGSKRENADAIEEESGKSSCTIFPSSQCTRRSDSKWPIETSVMVDIQKNEKLTPKLVTSGKTTVKTKTRSFKK